MGKRKSKLYESEKVKAISENDFDNIHQDYLKGPNNMNVSKV